MSFATKDVPVIEKVIQNLEQAIADVKAGKIKPDAVIVLLREPMRANLMNITYYACGAEPIGLAAMATAFQTSLNIGFAAQVQPAGHA